MGNLTAFEAVFIAMNGATLFWSVFSNVCILIIVISNRSMRTTTNLLICNLAISDTLFGGIVLPQNLHDISHTVDYHEGAVACRLVNFLPVLLIITSIYTIVIMSYERYRAVVKHSLIQITKKQMVKIVAIIWFGATLCTIPSIIEYSIYTLEMEENISVSPFNSTVSMIITDKIESIKSDVNMSASTTSQYLPSEIFTGKSFSNVTGINNGNSESNKDIIGTNIIQTVIQMRCGSKNTPWVFTLINGAFLLIVGYILPTILISVNYGRVVYFIVKYTRSMKQNANGQNRSNFVVFRKKVRIVKMLVIVAALFVACWMPYFTILIYAKITKKDDSEALDGWVNLFRLALSTFSVSYNAILYITCNTQFYNAFKQLLTCAMCRNPHQVAPASVVPVKPEKLTYTANSQQDGKGNSSRNSIGVSTSNSLKKDKNDLKGEVVGETNNAFECDV